MERGGDMTQPLDSPPQQGRPTRRIHATIDWRIVAIVVACVATAVLYVNVHAVRPRLRQIDFDDSLTIAVPLVCFLTALGTSVAVAVLPYRRGLVQGTLRGVFVGAGLFLHLMAWMLAPGAAAVLSEGTGYWASVSLPSFWLGLPLIIFGGLVGAKWGGAPIRGAVLAIVAVPLFWTPASILASLFARFLGRIAQRVFIYVFS